MKQQLTRSLVMLLMVGAYCANASAQINSTTVTFQQGSDGYDGTFDRRISTATNENGADVDTTATFFFIDGDPEDDARSDYLIRFDDIIGGAGVPSGAVILDAELILRTTDSNVSGNSQSGESYNVYRLAQPFDENSTLDGDFGDGDMQFTPFVDGVEPEQDEADFNTGTFDHPIGESELAVDSFYAADVTRAVQSWVNGAANYGVAVASDHVDNDDGWSVHSTGSPIASFRPQLSVTYTTDPVKVVELQQGLGGYSGTTDVALSSADPASGVDGATVSEVFIDGLNDTDSPDAPYLVHFDLEGLNPGEHVVKAELIFKSGITSGFSDSPGPFTVRQLLTPFSTSSTYGDFAGQVTDMETAGEVGPEVAAYVEIDEAELVSADVTSMVQNWLNGSENYGVFIGAAGTDNGWQIFTSGAADADLAPMLRVYTVPEPGAIVLALFAACGLTAYAGGRSPRSTGA